MAVWRVNSNTLLLWKKDWQYTASRQDELENTPLLSVAYYEITIQPIYMPTNIGTAVLSRLKCWGEC